ncbi:MAG: Rieske (2Fe-2S) protein [Candidatus Sumerlaeaceae bacterium]
MNRREFVETALAACACALCPAISHAQAGAAVPPAATPAGPVTIGALAKYAPAGVWDDFAKTCGFVIVSDKGRIYALSATCTHKRGGLIKDTATPGQLKCTKHDGKFNLSGIPVSGPPKVALARFAISMNAGQLIVDPTKKFEQTDWDKPAAFVKCA